jgi:hypothetical protein
MLGVRFGAKAAHVACKKCKARGCKCYNGFCVCPRQEKTTIGANAW